MKLKYFIVNIITIIVLFLICDFLFFCFLDSKIRNDKMNFNYRYYIEASKIKKFNYVYNILKETNELRHVKINKNNKTILIFGCSFAYSYALDTHQTLAYKLAKISGYNINNQSLPSLGIQYFPYILENFDININNEEDIIQKKAFTPSNTHYIIFVMIDDHIYRLYRYFYQDTEAYLDIRYKSTKEGLKEIKHKNYILEHFMIYRFLQNKYARYLYNHKSFDEKFDFMKLHFLKAQELARKLYPNSKIVILKYEEVPNSLYYNTPRWKELEDAGFIVLGTYELTGKHFYEDKFRISNEDRHPNELAWTVLTPALAKKLDL